ncbi:GerAB/ArcD/ProY family transporter [Thalassobacillus devorans]|uniref:GerAB/ArcD/ProY family transporter n=1 Tax=Thalassobacillus devorans TaxID=279813 RepID=UPI00159430CB|nr:GerAB/ArcD/ProY family transporter [Thalassobacillus devorans]
MNKKRQSKIDLHVPENLLVTPFFVFFLIHAMQLGVGILSFETYIARDAGYDAWISLLIAGAAIHLLLWIVYNILQSSKGDIVSIHEETFGKYIGGFLSIIFSLYVLLLTLTVLRTFIEVIQTWVFPQLNVWFFTLALLLLIYYLVAGGFRMITGLCLISVLLALPLLWLKFFPIQAGDINNVFPIIDHTLVELLSSAKTSILGFLGFELLLVFYPFIKNPEKSKKWAHYGVFFTTIIYVISAITAFIYFSEKQLDQVNWATISLWKIVEFPFVERFEFIGIALWLYVVIPNICFSLWAASRIPKRLFNIRQTYMVGGYCLILYVATIMLDERQQIKELNDIANMIGFYVLMYIPVLFLFKKARDKVRDTN